MSSRSIIKIINEVDYIRIKNISRLSSNLYKFIENYFGIISELKLKKFLYEKIISGKSLGSMYRILTRINNNFTLFNDKEFSISVFNTFNNNEEAFKVKKEFSNLILDYYDDDISNYLYDDEDSIKDKEINIEEALKEMMSIKFDEEEIPINLMTFIKRYYDVYDYRDINFKANNCMVDLDIKKMYEVINEALEKFKSFEPHSSLVNRVFYISEKVDDIKKVLEELNKFVIRHYKKYKRKVGS